MPPKMCSLWAGERPQCAGTKEVQERRKPLRCFRLNSESAQRFKGGRTAGEPREPRIPTLVCQAASTATAHMNATTLSELLQSARSAARSITYYAGERERRVVRYAELYERALGILHHLQQLGARPGDRLLLFLSNN